MSPESLRSCKVLVPPRDDPHGGGCEGGGTQKPSVDTGLICLALMFRALGLAADPEHLRHEYGPASGPFTVEEILRCAKRNEIKARHLTSTWERLETTPLPAIARFKEGNFVILAKVAPDQVLLHDPRQGRPFPVSKDPFLEAWSGELILLATRAQSTGAASRFDVSWFIPAIVKHRRLFGEVMLASLFLQLFALVMPLFFQVVIDKVLVHHGYTTLHVMIVGLMFISVFESLLGALRTYIFSHTTNRVDVELGAALFRHLTNLPMAYFGARRIGDTVARVRELENIRNFLTGSALTLVLDFFFTFVFLAVMFYYAPLLTWVVIGTIPCYVLLSLVVTPILRRRLDDKFKRGAENQAFLVEAVAGVETIKSLAVEPQMRAHWEKQLAGYIHSSFRSANLGNIANQSASLINKLNTALVLWFGAFMVIENTLTVGQLVAFNILSGRVSGPILRIASMWQEFQQVRVSLARLGDLLNTPTEPVSGKGRTSLPGIRGHIRFDGVTFRYRPGGTEILRNIVLDVTPGQVVGVVGSSGSGKSTLVKLVQRLFVPESGRILVDGVDLVMVDPAWLRRQIGVVLQENYLFNRSVRDNIALSDPSLGLDRVVRAAQLAGAHEFILELPQGYDTVLEERGSSLSGGQRQRIAIARALVGDPRILIFDEATSALDYESERIIQENMRSICAGRTVFIIAHRLSTVRHAHRIVVMERGLIVEDGNHEALLRQNGRYAHLYRLQSGER
ncbi:MAG: type I secretion system permease/ATPase [Magnetococcales bacterium]|nr:type I secretion system permease/ATPase [Magnetococcales bacterium]MBF0151201.1 type I secretion system permease/ATPase [Magnetococcales bacterium]MBF0632382.1 type I secretion system permease/ATPase [Magnetococcales bacterium]